MIKQQGKYQPELLKTYPPFKCDELELLFLTDWYISKINKNDPSKLSKITSIDEIGLYQEYNICYKLFYNSIYLSILFICYDLFSNIKYKLFKYIFLQTIRSMTFYFIYL